MKKIRLIELFGGIGSQAKALERIGANFTHHKMIEFDQKAVDSYNAVHNTNFETQDITKVKGKDLGITDTDKYNYLMTYSFPCQDLSNIGKKAGMQKGSGTRSGLLWEVERLLNETEQLPQFLVMENVPQVHGKNNKENFDKWCKFLEEKGYTSCWKDLNAKDYGIPQNRKRCFMVSILGDHKFKFPEPVDKKVSFKDILDDENAAKYRVTDEVLKKFQNTPKTKPIYKENTEKISHLEYDKECVMDYRYDEGLRVRTNDCIPTLTTKNAKAVSNVPLIYDKESIRNLSPKECWRAMGFDDEDFEKASKVVTSDTQLYKQAGNSIVVNVLEELFKKLFRL